MRTRAEIRNDLNANEDTMQQLREHRKALVAEMHALEASESIVKVNDTVWIALSRYKRHQYQVEWHKAVVLAIGSVSEGHDRPEFLRVRRYLKGGGLAQATLQTRQWKTDTDYQDEALRNVTVTG